MYRRTPACSRLFLAAVLALGATPAFAEDAREIFLKSLEPLDTTYVGLQVSKTEGKRPKERRKMFQRVYRKGSILRVDYSDGQVVFDDGKTQLLYLPKPNEVERRPSRLDSRHVEFMKRLVRTGRINPELVGSDTVAGRSAWVLELKGGRGGTRKIWIDKATYLQLRLDETERDGSKVSTYFHHLNLDGEPRPQQLRYQPPASARFVHRGRGRPVPAAEARELARAWGGLHEPKHVPSGYRFRSFYLHEFRGRKVLVSVWEGSGERNTITLFQGPPLPMGERPPAPPEGARLQVLAETRGQVSLALVAPASADRGELQRMLNSVGP
ncbi:MAG: LolA family protein [Armatimonadota bacterium]